MQPSWEHLKTIASAKLGEGGGGQTECIVGNSKKTEPFKPLVRKLPTCSYAKYRRTASASRNLELRPNGESQLLN